MRRHSLFLTIAAGFLVSGMGALDARAGFVPLPTTLDQLLPAGNFTTVTGVPPAETLTFSSWSFTSSSVPTGSAPGASSITVNPFSIGNETGFSLNGTLSAPANTMVDVTISYTVTAPAGELLNDALLLTTGGALGGGTGTYLVSETMFNPLSPGTVYPTLSASPGSPNSFVSFAGLAVNSLHVTKDIFLSGGSAGVSLSAVTQAFSSVPEPTSIALLGIGMTGFLAFRRLFKRSLVA